MRALEFEWARMTSLRSTWVLLAGCVLGGTVLGAFYRFIDATSLDGALAVAEAPMILLTFVASMLVARAMGDDYRYGMARTTLTLFPGRTGIFAARAVVSVVPACLAVVVGVVGAMVASGVMSGYGVSPGVVATVASRQGLYALVYLLLVLAVTTLTRSSPIGVVTVFVLALFLEQTLAQQALRLPTSVLPFASGTAFRQSASGGYEDLAVFAAYAVALLAAAWGSYRYRDA